MMGLHRPPEGPLGSTNLSHALFGRSPVPGSEAMMAGSSAAAEAASIAASLGGVPDLARPTAGSSLLGPGLGGYFNSVVSNEHAMVMSSENPDFACAPAPLPRLSGAGGPGGDRRMERPTGPTFATATAMAFMERGASGSATSSQRPSWVAPAPSTILSPRGDLAAAQALAYEAGFSRSVASPMQGTWSGDARLLYGRNAATSPATALDAAAEMSNFPSEGIAMARNYAVGPYSSTEGAAPPRVATWLDPSNGLPPTLVETDSAQSVHSLLRELRGQQQWSAQLDRPISPRVGDDLGAAQGSFLQGGGGLGFGIGSASMPHVLESHRHAPTRSVPMTPTSWTQLAGFRPAPAVAAAPIWANVSLAPSMPNYACPVVWPPPPLPPVNDELAARLEALEAQKTSSLDNMREKRLEQLKQELLMAQASANQGNALELQLEQCNADWKVKFATLETRLKEEDAAAAFRVEKAVREAELNAREEIRRLRDELQVVKADGERSLDDVRRHALEQIERLEREVRAAKEAEERAREEAQRRDFEISQLRGDLEQQQDGNHSSAEQLRKLEQRARDMEEELSRERAASMQRGSDVTEQRRTYEVEINRISHETEELRLRLRQVVKERDMFESDMKHLKKANAQRVEECKELRTSISAEKQTVKLMQAEMETRKAEVNMNTARSKLDSSKDMVRQSFSSSMPLASGLDRTSVRETFTESSTQMIQGSLDGGRGTLGVRETFTEVEESSSQMVFDVDLTDGPEADVAVKRGSMMEGNMGSNASVFRGGGPHARSSLNAEYVTRSATNNLITVDIKEEDSD